MMQAFSKVMSLSVAGYFTPKPYRAFTRTPEDKRFLLDFTLQDTRSSLTDMIASMPRRIQEFSASLGGCEVKPFLLGSSDLYEYPSNAVCKEFE